MAYLISDLKNDIERKMHDNSLDKISGNIYDIIFEAARNLLLQIDPQETKRISQMTNGLYDDVRSYAAPTDLKKIAVIRPSANATTTQADNFNGTSNESFGLYKQNNSFTIEHNSGVKTIKIAKELTQGSSLSQTNSTTDNGTWAAGGDASGLTTDTVNKISGSGSLKFNLGAGGTSGYIENSTLSAVDISSMLNYGSAFVWAFIPSTSITTITLRWGSDSSNYYSVAATTTHDGTAFVAGAWNLIRFDWSGATVTGSPVSTTIDYSRITFTYSSATAINNCRVDGIVFRLPSPYEILYFSKYLFRNSSGTWIEEPTADTDLINLDTDSYNLLTYEVFYIIAQEMQAEDSKFDIDFIEKRRAEAWNRYMRVNKSDAQKSRNTYYKMPARRS